MGQSETRKYLISWHTVFIAGIVIIVSALGALYATAKGVIPDIASYGYGTLPFRMVFHYIGTEGVAFVFILVGTAMIYVSLRMRNKRKCILPDK